MLALSYKVMLVLAMIDGEARAVAQVVRLGRFMSALKFTVMQWQELVAQAQASAHDKSAVLGICIDFGNNCIADFCVDLRR